MFNLVVVVIEAAGNSGCRVGVADFAIALKLDALALDRLTARRLRWDLRGAHEA